MVNIIGDDDKVEKTIKKETVSDDKNIFKDSSTMTIILIMGLILISSLWISVKDCPAVTCPNVTIPACPDIVCPEITCPDCPECPSMICENGILNTTNITYTNTIQLKSITLFNSTDMNDNRTINLNASTTYNQTTEFNITEQDLGELIVIRVNYD